jgi:hypothetical protein
VSNPGQAVPNPARQPWLRRALGFARPPVRLDESAHAELRERCEADVREQIGPDGSKFLPELLQQATDDYQEQDRRADRAERRASSIQAAVATLLGLTTAGGGLLISSGAVKDLTHRLAVSAVIIFIVISLIITAVHALATQATQHDWVRPNAGHYVTSRAGIDNDFEVEMLATLIAAARHNSTIADWKYDQLRHTANAFRVGLTGLVLVPIGLLVIGLLKG